MAFTPPEWAAQPTGKANLESDAGVAFPVDGRAAYVLGREPGEGGVVLDHPSVSRAHAALCHHRDGRIYLIDMQSREGTTVDGQRIPPNKPTRLTDGSRVTLGAYPSALVLRCDGGGGGGAAGGPARVRASHLLVKHAGSRRPSSWKEPMVTRSQEEALAMVEEFRRQLAAGADFATLASRESHCGSAQRGGDLGEFGRGQMQKPFERPVRAAPVSVAAPLQSVEPSAPVREQQADRLPALITRETVRALEAELDNGAAVAALRRFNNLLAALPAESWEAKLRPVMHELAYNLESFNPAFTAVLLRVQCTIGTTDYVRRDLALKKLIQPLAGEYGMHNGEQQARTHRELFSAFYADLLKEPLEALPRRGPPSPARAAIEYLADYEKTWMLDSFRALDARVLRPAGRPLAEWVFLEVHAEGEAEHAAIGHDAVVTLVPAAHEPVLRRAMLDHDRDMAAFYNHLADLLEC
eukprot:scaffold4.g4680.t1